MNLQPLLDDERRRDEERQGRRMPRRRVVLLVGAVGAVIAIGTGAALTAAAVSEINEYDQQAAAFTAAPTAAPPALDSAADPTPATTDSDPSASPAPASASGEASATGEASAAGDDGAEPAPGGIATILGYTVYDETSDLDLIPRPSAEFVEKWAIDVEVILMQSHLDAKCMAEKGFTAAFIPMWETWENGDTMEAIDQLDAFNDARNPEWQEAFWGADDQPLGDAYDWKQAGCHGAAVHYTGMDDAN